MAQWRINWFVFGILALPMIGMAIAGFFVDEEAETDDGLPLKLFLWGMAGFWLLIDGGILLVMLLMRRRRAIAMATWVDGTAEVLSASETGTYINNQPRIRFLLRVSTPLYPVYDLEHRETISMLELQNYRQGAVLQVKVNPENPEKLMITGFQGSDTG